MGVIERGGRRRSSQEGASQTNRIPAPLDLAHATDWLSDCRIFCRAAVGWLGHLSGFAQPFADSK